MINCLEALLPSNRNDLDDSCPAFSLESRKLTEHVNLMKVVLITKVTPLYFQMMSGVRSVEFTSKRHLSTGPNGSQVHLNSLVQFEQENETAYAVYELKRGKALCKSQLQGQPVIGLVLVN